MIRIKDNIINENKIIQMSINEENNLEIDIEHSFPIDIKNANFSDIEWDYDKEVVRKSLDNDIDLRTKIQELEEKNKTFEDYNKDLNNQLDKLEEENKKLNELVQFNVKTTATLTKRINKAINYIEEYYDNFGWQELRPSNLKELMEILRGE